jgi:hypothetical protein
MTTFLAIDADGLPRCQIPVDGQPCNGLMYLTPDGHYLACEKPHGRLIPVNSDRASLVRKAYRRRDNPSQADLTRRWKEALPVAVKLGTIYKMTDRGVRQRVAVYRVAEVLCESVSPANQETETTGQQTVACVLSRSGGRAAKLFAPVLNLTKEQVAKLTKKAKMEQK